VDEDDAAVEAALGAAVAEPGAVVVLAGPGGSGGEVVRRVAARLAGARLALHERFLEAVESDFASRGRAMPRRLDRLALLPQGAQLWAAPAGEAGWALPCRGALLAVLPRDSAHLGALVREHLIPALRARAAGGEVTLERVLRTAGADAAEVEERLGSWLGREAGTVSVTCLPEAGEVWVRLSVRGASRAMAGAALDAAEAEIREMLGPACYGRDEETLEVALGRLLVERRLTISVAESCTGGLVAHRLTNVPGSSRYFERGVVVYSNRAKEELLGVPAALLRAHGAVSAPVAEAMAEGICRLGGSPCGLAVTGIAGPDGGTPDKPVGTVFVAARSPSGLASRRFAFAGSREAIKWQSAQAALDMLRRRLLG
jgi:nicotinamide-nucleotide amidase